VAAIEAGRGVLGAVGMGFLMAILATPCSFAILATAFGWAQFQPLWLGTVGILLIGAGMAAPHAVLAAFPGIVSRIPRAGRWSELFKQFVGFVFLLIAAWLVGTQMQEAYPAWVLAYAVVLATCVWIWGTWVRYDAPARKRWSVRVAAVVIAAGAGLWMLSPPRPLAVATRPFDAGEISRVRAEGKTVLVKFTASWCLKCKLLDEQIYNDPEVAEALAGRGVVAFVGDVTRTDLPANDMLYGQLAQPGPPVTAILAKGLPEPILLVGSFSKDELLAAVDAARAGS
jgi:thiol:disulfide interchange protein DsbD